MPIKAQHMVLRVGLVIILNIFGQEKDKKCHRDGEWPPHLLKLKATERVAEFQLQQSDLGAKNLSHLCSLLIFELRVEDS